MNIISLFSGAGGLDLGFEKAGFKVVWANEFDKKIWETYRYNFPNTFLDTRSIREIPSNEIPDCVGIIGGPPCQSWSEAGMQRGINDQRGQLFFEFIRVLRDKQPLFFLAENVEGMLNKKHSEALNRLQILFLENGYTLSFKLLNAHDYNTPQDRKRVFFVGYRNDLNKFYEFPLPITTRPSLQDCIKDLDGKALSSNADTNGLLCETPNNEFLLGSFSPRYMSRNRVRAWNEPSFTIQATARHIPLHPQAPKMEKITNDVMVFKKGYENLYRRLSIRECARIQTFPDTHIFKYKKLIDGYKMVGNAVPVNLAYHIAKKILDDLTKLENYDRVKKSLKRTEADGVY